MYLIISRNEKPKQFFLLYCEYYLLKQIEMFSDNLTFNKHILNNTDNDIMIAYLYEHFPISHIFNKKYTIYYWSTLCAVTNYRSKFYKGVNWLHTRQLRQ